MVSQYDHCLVDLLHRHQSGELACEIPLIISNHRDTEALVQFYGIDFHHIVVNKDNKAEAEAAQFKLFADYNIDLIVLARYMQILSPDFVARYQRMKGKTVFYPMGFDDNGLPTERLVEKVKLLRVLNIEVKDISCWSFVEDDFKLHLIC